MYNKNKRVRHLLSILLAIAMLFSSVPNLIGIAEAAEVKASDGPSYVEDIALQKALGTAAVPNFKFNPQEKEYYNLDFYGIANFDLTVTVSDYSDLFYSVEIDGTPVPLDNEQRNEQYFNKVTANTFDIKFAYNYGDRIPTDATKLLTPNQEHVYKLRIGTMADDFSPETAEKTSEYTAYEEYTFHLNRKPYFDSLYVYSTPQSRRTSTNDLLTNNGNAYTTGKTTYKIPMDISEFSENKIHMTPYVYNMKDAGYKYEVFVNGQKWELPVGATSSRISSKELDFTQFIGEDNVAIIPVELVLFKDDSAQQYPDDIFSSTTYTITIGKQNYYPTITDQPMEITCNKETTDTLTVTATAPEGGELTYQWQHGNNTSYFSNIPGATSNTYTIDKSRANVGYYRCAVTNTVDGEPYLSYSNPARVEITLSSISNPEGLVQKQPGSYGLDSQGKETNTYKNTCNEGEPFTSMPLSYLDPEDGVELDFELFASQSEDLSNPRPVQFKIEGVGNTSGRVPNGDVVTIWTKRIAPTESLPVGTWYVWCRVTARATEIEGLEPAVLNCDKVRIEVQPVTVGLKGSGSQADPFQIGSAEDFEVIREKVADGQRLTGLYFKMTRDVTLPANWEPIGSGPSPVKPFAGILDGGNHTLTYAEGSKPLFDYVGDAVIKNLKIYGVKINGNGLINETYTDYGADNNYWTGCPNGPTLENVRLLAGSSTLRSGFMEGTGSGANTITIRNCVVEKGVTIGYDKQQYGIGSMVGRAFNGNINGSYSYADVYGTSGIGGLAGTKGQSMGDCSIRNSGFCGTITATGDWVGGIISEGYSDASAPNTPPVSFSNCYVVANITGKDYIGGIFGGEGGLKSAVNECSLSDSFFYGTITASGTNVGGIIGHYEGVNPMQKMTNNYFYESSGKATNVIGTVTNYVMPGGGDQYFFADEAAKNAWIAGIGSAKEQSAFSDGTVVELLNQGAYKNWAQGPDGYPVHDSAKVVVTELKITGELKNQHHLKDELNTEGLTFTAVMSNGGTKDVPASEITFSGYDPNTRGTQTVTASYGGVKAEFTLTVLKSGTGTIDVYFTLLGDSAHGTPTSDRHTHTLKGENLTTWLSRRAYEVDQNATVKDVLEKALTDNKISWTNPSGNYVESITYGTTTLAEFTNGKLSGWMYTLNGVHTDLGVSEQYLEDGNEIIFHYTDNYNIEDGSEKWEKPKDTTLLTPEVTADASGNAKANVGKSDMDDAIEVAKEKGSGSIVVNPEVKGTAKNVTVDIPKASAGDMANAGLELDVWTKNGNVTLPPEALKSLYQSSGYGDITVSVADAGSGRTAVEVAVGGKAVSDVTGGLTVTLPDLGDGDVVVIVGADGSETIVKKSLVESYQVKALLDGSCTVAVRDNAKSFTDVSGKSWYADEVEFASSHELFNGTSSSTFSPDSPMTRGMLATVLWRLEDEVRASGGTSFSDVAGNTWYTEGVAWASANKIVDGYGGGIFGPDNSITRQELATMLYRYAKQMDMNTAATGSLHDFSDAGKVGSWSKSAMRWAVGNGILKGYDNGTLNPGGNASRAEVATMLQRLVRLMVG